MTTFAPTNPQTTAHYLLHCFFNERSGLVLSIRCFCSENTPKISIQSCLESALNDERARPCRTFKKKLPLHHFTSIASLEKHKIQTTLLEKGRKVNVNRTKHVQIWKKMTKISKSCQNTANKGILDLPNDRPDSPVQIASFSSQVEAQAH